MPPTMDSRVKRALSSLRQSAAGEHFRGEIHVRNVNASPEIAQLTGALAWYRVSLSAQLPRLALDAAWQADRVT